MLTKAPRGTADILPENIGKWNYIEETAKKTAHLFGFSEIKTPVFEHTELFCRGVGDTTDVVQKEMYTFLDKAERSITLRPEGTASAARAYLEHSIYAQPAPQKLFYNITCYRYEKPQAGRMREFHQFGAEMYGSAEPSADAEMIAFVNAIFQNLGITGLKLNINSIGCPECRKKYNEALKAYLHANESELCATCHERMQKNPMRVLDCKSPVCKEIAEGAPSILDYICDECRAHFEKVQEYLNNMGIDFEVDPSIVRGLDYYTKTVFEFVSNTIGAQGTVCGGGRYDGLIESIGGNPTPAIGFAMGLERILLVMESMGTEFPKPETPDIYLVSMGQFMKVQRLCEELRCEGVAALCDLSERSLKVQMKNADRCGAKYSVVIGDDEAEKGKAQLKNMETGEKIEVNLKANDIKAVIRS